ncbi:MAG: metallophosphoesterase [Patescibacteria group bacterium]|jgi:predicted phosphodiesterase
MKKFVIFCITIFTLFQTSNFVFAESIIVTGIKQNELQPIRTYSLNTGNKIKEFYPYGKYFSGGINIAVGDLTGDNKDEIVVSPKSSWQPEIRVYTKRGKLLSKFLAYGKSFKNGIDIAVGDTNNDGKKEIITAPGIHSDPILSIFNYKGKKIMPDILAFPTNFNRGLSVATGDINSDSKDEIIVTTNSGQAPYVEIYNDQAKKIGQFLIFDQEFRGGVNIAAGDMNNDSYDEIAACQASQGTACKIFRFGFKTNAVKELSVVKYPTNIIPNFGNVNSDNNKELLISDSKKPILSSYSLALNSRTTLKLANENVHSEIAFIPDNTFNFVVYGDTQQVDRTNHLRIIEGINNQKYDFAFHVGDFTQDDSVNEWEVFQRLESSIINKTPKKGLSSAFFPVIGNHEYALDNYFTLFNTYPKNQSYYSFDYKNAHFVVLDTETDFSMGSTQYDWLNSDLALTNKTWKIVLLHRPPYNSNYKYNYFHPNVDVKNDIVPILEQYKVNIVFGGHSHIYERTYPIFQDQANFVNGITYVITAVADSNPIMPNWWTAKSKSESSFVKIQLRDNILKGYAYNEMQGSIDKFAINSNLSNL